MNLYARYAVIGNPVAHSHSPWIHAAFAQQTGQTLEYGRLLCPLESFRECLYTFATDGPVPAHGCNVTVPFKTEAYSLAQAHSARAQQAQAANTLRLEPGGGWFADNTDGVGLVRDIECNAGHPLAGQRILLIGAGGAAAGALGPLLLAQPAELVLANRSVDKAQSLLAQHQNLMHGMAARACGLDQCGTAFDIVINASASSLNGSVLALPPQVFGPHTLALDMMYGPAANHFLDQAQAQGARTRDGLGMLVEQAAESFFLWRGIRPDTQPVLASLNQRIHSSALLNH